MTGCPIDPQNRGNAVGGWNYTGPPQDRFNLGLEGIKRRLRSKWTNMVDLCDHMVGFPAANPPAYIPSTEPLTRPHRMCRSKKGTRHTRARSGKTRGPFTTTR